MNIGNKIFREMLRALIEIAFIVFLFYSNLLMGEYDKTGNGQNHSLAWVIGDIIAKENFAISIIAGLIGYLVFKFLRKKLN
jgi:hypothetical protein